ncbi:hypothetical protein B4102_3595 [Heyndrickxia sporothermodurans]|uniref:Uncharacterized protein n=1 Tax=Heyndrickxia sporothermodurans TaxID=46224 RepID=A0A150KM08_9BACI|nr:BC1881 family protein [Heyndrickxia sporothermodurans]KYC94374.1 hypothetical protein B4102_3595 [Heyndrickxia sporothermodurans]
MKVIKVPTPHKPNKQELIDRLVSCDGVGAIEVGTFEKVTISSGSREKIELTGPAIVIINKD